MVANELMTWSVDHIAAILKVMDFDHEGSETLLTDTKNEYIKTLLALPKGQEPSSHSLLLKKK